MTHHTDTGDLIMKLMPSVDQNTVHLGLADDFHDQMVGMGIPRLNRLLSVGCTTYFGPNFSKQADAAYKPHPLPPKRRLADIGF